MTRANPTIHFSTCTNLLDARFESFLALMNSRSLIVDWIGLIQKLVQLPVWSIQHLELFSQKNWKIGLSTHKFPNLYALSTHKHLSIKNWIRRIAHNTGLDFHPTLCIGEQQQGELLPFNALVHNTALSDSDDKAIWRWSADGKFSVRKAYDFLIFDGIDACNTPFLSKLKIPLRVKFFCGLLAATKSWQLTIYLRGVGKAPQFVFFAMLMTKNLSTSSSPATTRRWCGTTSYKIFQLLKNWWLISQVAYQPGGIEQDNR